MSYKLNLADIKFGEAIVEDCFQILQSASIEVFNILFSSRGEFNSPAQKVSAFIKKRTEGQSADSVYELNLYTESTDRSIGRYIIKIFSEKETAEKVRKIYSLAKDFGGDVFSSTIISTKSLAENVLVFTHASNETGEDVVPFHVLVEGLIENPDKGKCDILCNQLITAGQVIKLFYDKASHVLGIPSKTEQIAKEFYSSNIHKFPPDLVVDMSTRGYQEELNKETGNVEKLTISNIDKLFPDISVIDKQQTSFSNLLKNRGQFTSWIKLNQLTYRNEKRGSFYVFQDEGLGFENAKIVWINFPQNFNYENNVANKFNIILFPDDKLLKSATEYLADLGLQSDASSLLENHGEENTMIKLSLMHSDLHSNNFLVSQTNCNVKIIDLGIPEYSPDGTMAARVEMSLWKAIDKKLEENAIGIEIQNIIRSINGKNCEYEDDRVKYILVNVFNSLRVGFADTNPSVKYAYKLQALNFLRNSIIKKEKSYSCFSSIVNHYLVEDWDNNLTKYDHDEPIYIDEIPTDEHKNTIKDIWESALAIEYAELTGNPILLDDDRQLLNHLVSTSKGFFKKELTDLQEKVYAKANEIFLSNANVIISGPTSSGKSTLIELFMARCARLNSKRKCAVYIAPTRSLTRAKFVELKQRFKGTDLEDKILMSTGEERDDDWKIQHGRFSIACMVYEKANMLLSQHSKLVENLGCVIIDELHMIMDIERGPILELALTKLATHRKFQVTTEFANVEDPLRIICITTEANNSDGIVSFLQSQNSSPIIIESKERPIEVTHHILIPIKDETGQYTCITEEVVNFSNDNNRTLSGDMLFKTKNKLTKYRIRESDRYYQDHIFLVNFINQVLEKNKFGYRALVFVPGKEDALTFGKKLYDLRKNISQSIVLPEFIHKLNTSEDPKSKSLIELAGIGIFIHHADLEKDIRNEIEDMASVMGEKTPSQVIFCTETLSYGVNLAINDVFVYGIDFWSQTRKREPLLMSLSSHTFHNIVGRAGRLGKNGVIGNNVYVFMRAGMDPSRLITLYYTEIEKAASKIYVTEDREIYTQKKENAFTRLIKSTNSDIECPGFEFINATEYTYPFVRSVLDVLRYLNAKTNPENLNPVTVEDITSFLGNTIFGRESHKMSDEQARIFKCSVKYILKSCSEDDLALVKADGNKYIITARGQSVIDTGTELTTIAPAWKLIRSFHKEWASIGESRNLPAEMYLLVILAVPEICRRYLLNTPECKRHSNWSIELALKNRESVRSLFSESCSKYLGIENETFIDKIIECLQVDSMAIPAQPGYELGRADGILRTFCSILAWINFVSLSQVITIFEKGTNPQSQGNLSNFRNFIDTLNWRMLFLNILLESSNDTSVVYNYDDALSVGALADRIRLGCTENAIPLFWPTRESRIKRSQANELIQHGLTPKNLLKFSYHEIVKKISKIDPDIQKISSDQLNKLISDIERFTLEQYSMLINEIGINSTRDLDYKQSLFDMVLETPDFLRVGIATYKRSSGKNPDLLFANFILESLSGFDNNIQISTRDTSYSEKFRLNLSKFHNEPFFITQELSFSKEEEKQIIQHESQWRVIGVHLSNDNMAYIRKGTWTRFRDYLNQFQDVGNILFITLPWMPENFLNEVQDLLEEREKKGYLTRFISLSCFVLHMGLILKSYTSGKYFFDLLKTRGEKYSSLLGIQEFYLYYKSNGGQKLIPAIEEKLIGYFEVV